METEAVYTVLPEMGGRRIPAPWVRGMPVLPFGLALGFMSTALPFLLTRQGVPLGRVASISATVLSPAVFGVLFKPVLDAGLSRATYCWMLTGIAAVSLAVGVTMLTPAHLSVAEPALLISALSMVLYSGAMDAWASEITVDRERGSVAGWVNVANLGGGALGSFAVMALLTRNILNQAEAGVLMAVLVCAGAAPLLWFPKARPPAFRFREVLTSTMVSIGRAVRRRECLIGFALLLSPASATGANNLLSGLGKDFHTPESTVIWLSGMGAAALSAAGALIGGRLSNRFPRWYVYLFAGLGTVTISLAAALLPHTAGVFTGFVLLYSLVTGTIYVAYNALAYELTGQSPVAATQLGLLAASINFSLTYMTKLDGIGYQHGGARGLLLVDGLASLAGIVPMLFLARAELRRARRAAAEKTAAG